ncbi:PREDICTED: probable serine/threonine-protein kinase DDB_G0282963 isoform X2 [Vollenhovia emeryi]|uniref:probable serine/threonine-protein kinase DDB_G0282963 isoform X2 n=1 Tax=Vollenhovia emeryi TaxID=411798 RepID=UPI0005F3D49B|nr:PREDICTED: probable serine/threonine-protein kinase DDB_G0282963 isoform X2 [Vollenhovia emeryi]XP_011866891.1 PREDICTED: probable serine/threonine-protein kinase DDB_G0282963 isoform X2 [Vollenhovia emeryi]XP_011866892.1 PREDICTED: probable serine/threonine-protein kinase DDB_G0282963 isoform X2 [Vollenhovia emeryi]
MDYAVESLEKTSDVERKAMLNKLHNMQWLKNTSHSANPGKIRAVVYKQVQEQDEDKIIEHDVAVMTETVKTLLAGEPVKCSSTDDTGERYLRDDAMPENENIWSKNVDAANLFPNADKLADQKNEEDMLSIVESIVTAKLDAKFCMSQEHKNQTSTSENNTEDVVQNSVHASLSDSQKTVGGVKELKLLTRSDGNNNNSTSTPCVPKVNDKQKSTCKMTNIESNKASTEAKDKDAPVKMSNVTKIGSKAGSSTNLTKDNEKSSSPNNDPKKTVSSKSLSTVDKTGKEYFNNKQNNTKAGMKKQEFVKQRNVSRNGMEKEMKSAVVKPNLAKTAVETADTAYLGKSLYKDKALQKQQQATPKHLASKSKSQESIKRNASTLNISDDKNKTEKATHMPENVDSPLNGSERKTDKIVDEKNVQSDQKVNRGVDFKKNATFVAQYRNSTFSRPMQHNPRTGLPPYGRSLYGYNNPRFDRYRNGNAERRVTKKEHAPTNTLIKSNTGIEKLDTRNVENCAKQKNETIQPTSEVDTSAFNDGKNINPVKVETHLVQSKENTNLSVDHPEQEPIMSEQCRVETNDFSKVYIDQQHKDTNYEDTDLFTPSSNLPIDECATSSQVNVTSQYSSELENIHCTSAVNQLESSQATWNPSSDNAAQKDVSVMSLQQSVQSIHFNTQHTFTQAGNSARHTSPWEPSNGKFYDQHFSVSDAMRLSQIPNTFNAPPYECNAPMSSDSSHVAATSTLETMSNRENSNMLYRYGSGVQQRPVMASDFLGHSISCQANQANQANQARWSSSVQEPSGYHVEHPYIAAQPAMMHVYNPAVFGPDDFNNMHTTDYMSHPILYAPSPYMQTWNSQLQYPMPVVYNSACTNYTTFSQPNNFNNSMHDQQHRHNSYMQMNNYIRDTYNDTNTCAAPARNTTDNVPIKSNYYKRYQDNCRTYEVPQYAPPVSYSRSQQGMNVMPATGVSQYNAPYYPTGQKHYKQNVTNYMKNPKSQMQDFTCDDNGSEDSPPIISPTEFVTSNINLSNKTDQFATRVFKPEYKMRPNTGYRPPPFLPRYNNDFRRNTFQEFPKEYTYPTGVGRGAYKAKRT